MTKLIMIHGYNHNPDVPEHSASRPGGTYDYWNNMLPNVDKEELHWYSGRQGLAGRWHAIRNGYLRNTYAYAYSKLCLPVAERLVMNLDARKKHDIIAHSLGARVALLAINMAPLLFRRVLILNGAETAEEALPIIEQNPHIEFLNICVSTDDVLRIMGGIFEPKLGYHGCMGRDGIDPNELPSLAKQIFIDLPYHKDFYRELHGWNLEGNNPNTLGDHLYSYKNQNNWPLYQEFLKNGNINL